MKFKTILKKYPKMEVVLDTLMVMKREGTRYKELREIWEKEAYRLYPEHYREIRFPSRTTLWKLEREYWHITCELCQRRIPREEGIPTFLTKPTGHWTRVCRECYINLKAERLKERGHSPFIGDYIFVKRRHGVRYIDPRSE
jgi:hypothetical protein